MIVLGFISIANAQNTTRIIAGSNVTIDPPSGVGAVTINASGGGGGGSGTITNVVSTFDAITASGVGTPVITLSRTPNLSWTNNNGFVDVTGGFNTVTQLLVSKLNNAITNDYGNGILYGSLGDKSVNYNGRTLNREGGTTIVDFQNAQIFDTSGTISIAASQRALKDNSALTSVDYGNDLLKAASVTTVNWSTKALSGGWSISGPVNSLQALGSTGTNQIWGITYFGTNTYSDANCGILFHRQGSLNNITDKNMQFFFGDTFGSDYGYIQPGGLTAGGAWNMSWQGNGAWNFQRNGNTFFSIASTRVDVFPDGVTRMLTSSATTNSFGADSTSTNNFNGNVIVNNNAFFKSGMFVNVKITPTNYTDSVSDFMVGYKGTILAQVTNFLPAISTQVTNGFSLIIKDAQASAGTTNIIILPSGSDTIDFQSSKTINANGQSVNITVDAVNKNWMLW